MTLFFLPWTLVFLTLPPGTNDELLILPYRKDTVTDVTGLLTEVREGHWYSRKEVNLVGTLSTSGNEELVIDLGPSHLYRDKPRAGERVQAHGSLVKSKGQDYFLTNRIKVGQRPRLKLRTKRGLPVWFKSQKHKGFHHRMDRMSRMRKMKSGHN